MRTLLLTLATIFIVGVYGESVAQSCYETTVQSPTPFMGNNGEIVKLADGTLWEVKYAYEYLYEYHPSVIICPQRGRLIVDNKSIDVQLLSGKPSAAGRAQPVIESSIVSKFEGLNAGNIYRLANGQIWEQIEPWVWVWIWVNPKVIIFEAAGGYKMKVENIEHAVLVRQLK